MRSLILSTLCFCLIGCNSLVPILLIDERENSSLIENYFEPISEACQYWNIDCIESEDGNNNGSLTIILTDSGGYIHNIDKTNAGRRVDDELCSPVIWSHENSNFVTHEMGHAFGLEHSSNENNIMFINVEEGHGLYSSTEKQQRKVHRRAEYLANCIAK